MYSNKAKQKQFQKEWYQKHKQRIKAKHAMYPKQNKTRLVNWMDWYKSTLECCRCSENHSACLHFHHRNPDEKRFTISQALRLAVCLEELCIEICKCDVLCANCHAKLHSDEVKSKYSET